MSPGGRPRQLRKKPSKLGAAITRARGDRSQAEVARRAGLSTTYLSALEGGERKNPGLPVLQRLAKVLGVPMGTLLGAEADLQRARTLIARRQARLLPTIPDTRGRAIVKRVFQSALEALDDLMDRTPRPSKRKGRPPKPKP
jgi:transcriptional regulator with XRE-family HTH domain